MLILKHVLGVFIRIDIKREAQPSVLYLIKHSYACFKWLKNDPSDEYIISEVIFKINFV